MLAYAAGRQGIASARSSPSTMLMIIGGHVAVVALAMSAKFIIDAKPQAPPTMVDLIETEKVPPPPPPEDSRPEPQPSPPRSDPYVPAVPIPMPPLPGPSMGTTTDPSVPTGPLAGNDPPRTVPFTPPTPIPDPVRLGPRLATSPSALRPPYPASKLDSQEGASLRLKLTIDERGRVIAVEPVGANDPAFMNAARRHLIAKWRYQPATVDGKPIMSSTVITLRFELEG